MSFIRSSGILLHPTSLPGPLGIGELGQAARQFIDYLVQAKQSLWQVLPLGPTGYGDSPYASFSSFAGNPLLIDLTQLVVWGDLSPDDIADVPQFPVNKVDYGWVIHWKMPLLEKAATTFLAQADPQRRLAFENFCQEQEQAAWLDDYALFMAVKAHFDQKAQTEGVFGAMWQNYWPRDIALGEPNALQTWRDQKAETIIHQKIWQFYFFQQWQAIRTYAQENGIKIIGDIPIFVAPDSADVWANRDLFYLDEAGQPTVLAGVPPDYFSETGQRWGNPLYDWEKHRAQRYAWWLNRLKATLSLVDMVRIDHFRGFEAYWEIPAAEKTAVNGKWVKAPGHDLFQTIQQELGPDLPIIAEDLGVITPEVEALRETYNLPGMKVLQFAFNLDEAKALDASNNFLPHNYTNAHCVVYTGTHDNETTLGWYQSRSDVERDLVRRYLAQTDNDIVWGMIRLVLSSVAVYAIIPLQDILGLDNVGRMNTPSTLGNNWHWRYQENALSTQRVSRLREMTELYGRDLMCPKMSLG